MDAIFYSLSDRRFDDSYFRHELEGVAVDVINILKGIDKFKEASIAIIGGLAVWKYMPYGRQTENVDLIIDVQDAPGAVEQELLRLPSTRFVQHGEYFFFKTAIGRQIQVDFRPSWQSPYMPDAAMKLKDLSGRMLPYISHLDLIVFKIHCFRLRNPPDKQALDIMDAESLLIEAVEESTMSLSDQQKTTLEPCIADLARYGSESEEWWRLLLARLGMPEG